MPLEIRELNIQVNVGGQQGGENNGQPQQAQPAGKGEDKQGVIKQCVEEIMDMINKQKER